MSYAEFPHTELWDEDCGHHELIKFYLEVREKYTETLNLISQLSIDLDEYRRTMDTEINDKVSLSVQLAVDKSFASIEEHIITIQNETNLLRSSLKTLSDTVNNMNDRLVSSINELDSRLTAQVNAVSSSLRELITINSNAIRDCEIKFSKQLSDAVDELNKVVSDGDNSTLSQAQGYALNLNARTVRELELKLDELVLTSDAKAIRWLWEYGCCHGGFTAGMWYHLTNIKCSCWNKISPTAWQWYTMGKELFARFRRTMKMYSPVSGRYVDVRVALLELATKLKVNSLTAGEYESLELTADEYERYGIDAYDYDWEGKEILNVHEGN